MYNDLAFYNECTNKRSKGTMCTCKKLPSTIVRKKKLESTKKTSYTYNVASKHTREQTLLGRLHQFGLFLFVLFVVFTCGTQERIHCTNNIATAMMTLARHHSLTTRSLNMRSLTQKEHSK